MHKINNASTFYRHFTSWSHEIKEKDYEIKENISKLITWKLQHFLSYVDNAKSLLDS